MCVFFLAIFSTTAQLGGMIKLDYSPHILVTIIYKLRLWPIASKKNKYNYQTEFKMTKRHMNYTNIAKSSPSYEP